MNKFTVLPEQNHYQPAKQTDRNINLSVECLVWIVVKSFSEKWTNPLVDFVGQSVIFLLCLGVSCVTEWTNVFGQLSPSSHVLKNWKKGVGTGNEFLTNQR